jgi:hypothetical protein
VGRNRRQDPHDEAGYRQRRKLLLESVTPLTKCGRCGRLLSDHPRHRNGRPATWHADHVDPGNNRAPLILSASTCNMSAGGVAGNVKRWGNPFQTGNGFQRNGNGQSRAAGPHAPWHYSANPQDLTCAPCLKATGTLCPTCAAWHATNPTTRR